MKCGAVFTKTNVQGTNFGSTGQAEDRRAVQPQEILNGNWKDSKEVVTGGYINGQEAW